MATDKPNLNELLGRPLEGNVDLLADEFPVEPIPPTTDPDDFTAWSPEQGTSPVDPHTRMAPQRPVTQSPKESVESPDSDDPDERELIREIIKERREARVCQRFIEEHASDYVPSPASWAVMQEIMEKHKLSLTPLGLETAFAIAMGHDAPAPQPQPQPPAKRIQTGLPDRPGEASPTNESSLTQMAIDLQKLPLEQARTKMSQLMLLARTKQQK